MATQPSPMPTKRALALARCFSILDEALERVERESAQLAESETMRPADGVTQIGKRHGDD